MDASRFRALATALGALAAAACARGAAPAVAVACTEIRPVAPAGAAPARAAAGTAPAAAAAGGDTATSDARATDAPADSSAGFTAPPLAVQPSDVLELVIVLDSVPAGPGEVLVRVDRLADPGIVKFFMPPPTAAAAGMTLAPPPVFQGCAGVAPVGLELRAPVAPRGKAWIRASTDRAVRVRVRAGHRHVEEPLLIEAGTSGLVRWEGA